MVFSGTSSMCLSETSIITQSLSMETSVVLLWLVGYSFLENSSSQVGSRDPWWFLRPFHGGCNVKSILIMILRCGLPFSLSFSHKCTVCFKEAIGCIHNYLKRLFKYSSLFQLVHTCIRLNFLPIPQPNQHIECRTTTGWMQQNPA